MTVASAQADKVMNARCRLLAREPWMGAIAMRMKWTPSEMPWQKREEAKTMGVRIVNGGDIECLYYPKFTEKLSLEELYAVIQHEIEHIVRCHCVRVGSRNPMGWNIAADMCINGRKSNPRIGYKQDVEGSQQIIVPMKDTIVWIPSEWDDNLTAEQYYDMLEKIQIKLSVTCPNCGNGSGNQNGDGDGEGESDDSGQSRCPNCGSNGDYEFGGIKASPLDDHSVWNQSDVSEDEARQMVKDIVDQATSLYPGSVPGHLIEAINELKKPVVRWREVLRGCVGRNVGNSRKTFSRRNRRYRDFGIAGISHRAAATVNVIIDTSGSIDKGVLEQFFAEIECLSARAKIFVLQWDHAFQGYCKYRRGDWKKFEVHGRGGTDMAAPMRWLRDQKVVADLNIMLTDGYTGWADDNDVKYKAVTVITTDQPGPLYGQTIHMQVE